MTQQKYPLTVTSLPRIFAFSVFGLIFTTFLFLVAQSSGKIEPQFFAGIMGGLGLIAAIVGIAWWRERISSR